MTAIELRLTALAAIGENGALVLVEFSDHAVQQFQARVRPGITKERALLEPSPCLLDSDHGREAKLDWRASPAGRRCG